MGFDGIPTALALGASTGGVAGGLFRKFSKWASTDYINTKPGPWHPMAKAMRSYPKRKYARRFKRKRRSRRRFRARRRRSGIPLRMWRRLRTVMYWSPQLGASGELSQVYLKLNSIYDPTGSIGTSQPYTHDQLATLYKKYQVTSYHVKIEWVSADNTYPVVVGFTPLTETTALAAYAHYMEISGTVSRMCTMDVDKTLLYKNGKINSSITPGSVVSDDVLQADVGADPSRLLFGHVWAQVVDAAADAGNVTAVITLTQVVKFFEPVTVARS